MKKNLKVIQFLLFLLSNKALVSFFRNRMLNSGKGVLEAMSFVRKYVGRTNAVFYCAFIFEDSKEKHDYWNKLSEKWVATNNITIWESLKNCFRR